MGMSGTYGPADDGESIATIHAALDAGVALLDTGDFYGMGHNEMLIRDALAARRRDEAVISVKFGALRGPDNRFAGNDCRPAAVRNFLGYTLRRLGTDHVDVYRPARVDPDVPIEETVGTIAELVQEGYVRHVGLSEVSADTLRRAHAVHPICDVQIEYSLLSRGAGAGAAAGVRAAGRRRHRLRRPFARPARRALLGGRAARRRRHSRPCAAFRGREPGAQPRARRAPSRDRRGGWPQRRTARDRLGPGAG